jgi:hypothetical protein
MLPYLSRVSLWLAALAAAASLFTSGREGVALATVAIVALIGALVMRAFQLKTRVAPVIEVDRLRPLDEAAMFEIASLLTRRISQATTLLDALRETRDELIHELGARGVVVHGPTSDKTPLVLAERFPLGEALRAPKSPAMPRTALPRPSCATAASWRCSNSRAWSSMSNRRRSRGCWISSRCSSKASHCATTWCRCRGRGPPARTAAAR